MYQTGYVKWTANSDFPNSKCAYIPLQKAKTRQVTRSKYSVHELIKELIYSTSNQFLQQNLKNIPRQKRKESVKYVIVQLQSNK